MARPRNSEAALVKRARLAVARATTVRELRAAQAVLLPADAGATLTATAALLGVGRATAARLQQRFRQGTAAAPRPGRGRWGGRRHALLTPAAEAAFLAPWLEPARTGGLLVVAPLRAALAQQLGHPIQPSVVYRLLARHGWRKVAPDTRHPKSDPAIQENWKKNSRKNWRPF